MGAGAREVEALDRQPVAAEAQHRAPREELVERHLGVHRMAAGEPVVALEVERGEDVAVDDEAREARRRGVERRDHPVRQLVAAVRPSRRPRRAAFGEPVRRELDEHAHDVPDAAGRVVCDQRRVQQ